MALLTTRPLGLEERVIDAVEEAEIARDHALSLAYRAGVLRAEAAALVAQAEQVRRRVAQGRLARREPVA
jgi:hypothetical protein